MTSSDEKTLGIQILGRLLGSTVSHEIVHSLIGATLSGGAHNAPAVPGDLMNQGRDTSFQEKTGFEVIGDLGNGPLTTVIFDMGIHQMVVPGPDSQNQINAHFPVPPAFA
jgi:hypothetical protein